MGDKPSLKTVSDDELLRRLSDLTHQSRRVEADLVAHIGEVDARKLYAREAAPSMFAYCTEILHLSEAEAWLRILVARATREHPVLLAMLGDGRLHLSGIRRLAPHLTPGNRQALLKRAVHKSRRQIEELVAEMAPRPDAPAQMRKLPGRREAGPVSADLAPVAPPAASGNETAAAWPHPAPLRDPALSGDQAGAWPAGQRSPDLVGPRAESAASLTTQLGPDPVGDRPGAGPARPARVEALAPTRYKVQFTASAELHGKLERLQALMRSAVPDGDLAALIELAVTEKLERLEARRFARVKAPRKSLAETDTTPASRHIPASVRRAVYERDEGRCTYMDAHGRRCTARERLEFHHRRPFGRGGGHSPDNLALACRTHNALMAEQDYGKTKMAHFRRSVPGPPRREGPERVSEPTALYGSVGHGAQRLARADPTLETCGPGSSWQGEGGRTNAQSRRSPGGGP